MRMWNVKPEIMCRQHLLGEHLEMHMFRGAIKKKINIAGYEKGLVARGQIKNRHDKIANEMKNRGYNHKSPMANFNEGRGGFVDKKINLAELRRRCRSCRALQKNKVI